MRDDLYKLRFHSRELKELTGKKIDLREDSIKTDLYMFAGASLLFLSCSILLFWKAESWDSGGVAFLFFFAFLMSGKACLEPFEKWLALQPKLIKEVRKFNQLLSNIDILDQLEIVGNPVKLSEREKVLQAFKINRSNLVRALQTDRILRENPKFRPELFSIDLRELRALQSIEKATEYGLLLDEALQLGVDVQTEMRKLENKRLDL